MTTRMRTQQTGKFGGYDDCWWATRWSYDGLEGEGTGVSEREALKAAEADIEEQRAVKQAKRWSGRALGIGDHPDLVGMPSLF